MLFSNLFLATISLALAAEATQAADLVVLEEFTSNDGVSTITVYGDAVTSPAAADIRGRDLYRRCGSNVLRCDNSHEANRNACISLVNDLRGSSAQLPGSPRSICGTYNGQQCCVSWHNPVSNAVRSHLAGAAQKALDGCRGDNGVSGKTSDTLIGSTCTDQCLSNRATGC
ncbi:hypothetical protein SAMD00023353_3200330 [Rosellinia necatrix]|uniref:WD-like domain-containing protein n=1 Tax=Rosellinia necatrix TaxID=77044 RepID=A0A1W2TIJ7_ROSNE|nr:hypothetical protein SAMD00023353_3200330 [Rosellinia necatrix]